MRYSGKVGFANTSDQGDGVHEESFEERSYFGDVRQSRYRRYSNDTINDELSVSTEISIVADEFAFEHFSKIKYAEWMGEKWDVQNVRPAHPRLILTLGEVLT